jgi:hypothetical protein
MPQFRICKSMYTDEYGNPRHKYYYIQRKKSFLGVKYWSDIKNTWGNTTHFDTFESAHACCTKMDKGVKPHSWKDEVVSYI